MSPFQIITLVIFLLSFMLMRFEINKSHKLGVVDRKLSGWTKIAVILLCFLNPILAGAVFYFGWRKQIPSMAKQSNIISIVFFLVGSLIFFGIFVLNS